MSSEVERVRLVLEDSDATDFPSSRDSNVRTLLILWQLVVSPSHSTRPPSATMRHGQNDDPCTTQPFTCERRAGIHAAAYRKRHPSPQLARTPPEGARDRYELPA